MLIGAIVESAHIAFLRDLRILRGLITWVAIIIKYFRTHLLPIGFGFTTGLSIVAFLVSGESVRVASFLDAQMMLLLCL